MHVSQIQGCIMEQRVEKKEEDCRVRVCSIHIVVTVQMFYFS